MAQQGDETILDEAKNLLVQGKRFMALEDYQSATDSLEQACQLFDAFYGVAKRPCADAYLEYGLALVALANLEAGTGTDKIMKKAGIEGDEEEDEEGDDEEEEEDGDEEDDEAEKEQNGKHEEPSKKDDGDVHMKETDNEEAMISTTQASNNNHKQEATESTEKTNGLTENNIKSDDKTDNTVQKEEEEEASSSSSATTAAAATKSSNNQKDPTPGTSSDAPTTSGGDNGINGDDKDSEDVDNEEATTIEIAWEVLCLAKRLFMEDESLEGRLKLAETLQKIGEISIEWDNNDNAVSILEECLKIRKAILHPDDRLIALTYYNLGLAHSFKSDTVQANENFQNAIGVIEHRIKTLIEDLEKAKTTQDTVAIGAYQKEINELKELLPDMTMRLDDSKEDESGIDSTEALKRTREEMQLEDEEVKKVCLNTSKPVDDISHLVKRKAT